MPLAAIERVAAPVDRVRRLARGASLEIAPRQLAAADGAVAGTEIYVPQLPQAAWRTTVAACERLRGAGLVPVPHLAARSLASAAELDDRLAQLAALGVDRLLLIAGDEPRAGAFANTLAVLETGLLTRHGFGRLGVAAHPEGHPHAAQDELEAALAAKVEYAKSTATQLWVVTQFAFASPPLLAFLRHMREAHPGVAVRVGIPGPAKLRTLLAFAAHCGVGASARTLTRRPGVVRLFGQWTPDALLADLAEHWAATPDSPLAGIHVFTFGGAGNALRWLRSLGGSCDAGAGPAQARRMYA